MLEVAKSVINTIFQSYNKYFNRAICYTFTLNLKVNSRYNKYFKNVIYRMYWTDSPKTVAFVLQNNTVTKQKTSIIIKHKKEF